MNKDRILGNIYGQCVGDAIGATYEFLNSQNAIEKIKQNKYKNFVEMTGGGIHNVKVGQYTDDTEMTLGLWQSILDEKEINPIGIAEQFDMWLNSGPFDCGKTTKLAIHGTNGDYVSMCENAKKYCYESLSNGCLMKISPLGAACAMGYCTKLEMLWYVKKICELTNPNPICIDMCKAYVMAIYILITKGDADIAYASAYMTAEHYLTRKLLCHAKETNKRIELENGKTIKPDGEFMGYVGIAFQNAFYQLLRVKDKSFYEMMIDTIELGGDTDTNACIMGALVGSYVGMSSIPTKWIYAIDEYVSDKYRMKMYEALNHQEIIYKITTICDKDKKNARNELYNVSKKS